MRHAVSLSFALVGLAVAGAGCTVRTRSTVETTPIRARIEVTAPQPPTGSITVQAHAPPSGVTVLEAQCSTGAAESCNGLDDNCDGRIDEGCGWESGQIQITLAWNTGADIDLYVTDPFGQTINYQARQSNSGGVLDRDARGACAGGDTIENVYWTSPQPPRGVYQVELHYWGSCGVAGPTPTTVSISVGGRVIGVYNVTLYDQQRIPVAAFQL
jgi:hypothetical protein